MFEIELDSASHADLDRFVRFFNTLGYRISSREQKDIADAVHDGFTQNFILQRSGSWPWQALSPNTEADRIWKGFPPKRPILYRTGDFRDSFTEEGDPDHFSQAWPSSNRFVLEEGSDDKRAYVLQRGNDFRNIPPRPVVDLMPSAEQHVENTIHDMLNRLLRSEGL